MKHTASYGHALQTTYFPGSPSLDSPALTIARIGETQGNGRFTTNFLTPYSWGMLGLSGEAEIIVGGSVFPLKKNALHLFRANIEVRFTESKIAPFRYLWFDVRGTAAEKTLDRHLGPKDNPYVLNSTPLELLTELRSLQRRFESESYSPATQVASAWKLLDCICRVPNAQSVDVAHSCRTLIETDFLRGVSITAIAAKCGVSRSTLYRKFKVAYSQSPKEYVDELRVQHACSLLLGTHMNTKEIAFQSGFDTTQNFYRTFKKRRKLRPSEYRNRPSQINSQSDSVDSVKLE